VRPRVHNVVSYSLALLVFWGVLLFRTRTEPLSATASLGACLWTAHFVRRTLESALVHRYAKPRVGAADYLSEYAYYWGFGGWIAWSLTAPTLRAPLPGLQALGLALFVVAEAGNAKAHLMLRDLRAVNGNEVAIPRGFLFERVSCPHYLCEILAWLAFNCVTGTWAGLSFMLVGAGILGAWARARHLAYRQRFDGQAGRERYPATRRALIPFLF
jgi:very-long-chain enoyl-CoA reductase